MMYLVQNILDSFQVRQRRADAGVDGDDGTEGDHPLRPLHHPARLGRGGRRSGRSQPRTAGLVLGQFLKI